MAEMRQFEFLLLRYAPDAVKGEFVNFGVVLLEAGPEGGDFADLRITRDWSRVRCIDPDADIEMLEALEGEIREQFSSLPSRSGILKRLEDSFSNVVQLSGRKACLTESPQAEMERLAKMYLESSRREKRTRDAGARTRIASRMREAFEEAGVWSLMRKKIGVSEFTQTGDPLKIDCGYRPNGVIKMFHAVSLATDVDAAKVLAYSYGELAAGIAKKENAKSELTAIVEDKLEDADEYIGFAMATLQKNAIRIAKVTEMDKIAETARKELRA